MKNLCYLLQIMNYDRMSAKEKDVPLYCVLNIVHVVAPSAIISEVLDKSKIMIFLYQSFTVLLETSFYCLLQDLSVYYRLMIFKLPAL